MQAVSESAGEGVKPAAAGGTERCRGPDCEKPVKPGSVYCTEACIHAHAQESLQLLRQERSKNTSARSELKVCSYSCCSVTSSPASWSLTPSARFTKNLTINLKFSISFSLSLSVDR